MRGGKVVAATLVVMASGWAGALGARAAADGSSTTAQTAITASTTSTSEAVSPGSSTTTTAQGGVATSTTRPGTTTTTAGAQASSTPTTIDAGLWSMSQSVRRSGTSSTAALLAALAPLSRYGLTPVQIAIVGMGQFPVAGPASYSDDWLEYRSFPTPHLHMGVDVDAAYGTPLRSPASGTLQYTDSDPDGYGLTAMVTAPDRTFYVLAHMSATVLGLTSGAPVKQGQVIGFVGSSGDATGPHLHFEVHPNGGAGVDPKPILDSYLNQAIAAAPAVIAAFAGPTTSPTTTAVPAPAPPPSSQSEALSSTPALAPRPWSAAPLLRALALIGVVAAVGAAWETYQRRRPRAVPD